MCTFITVAIPKSADFEAVQDAFTRAGLGMNDLGPARPTGVNSDEHYFFTATKHCDCGTMLGSATTRSEAPLPNRRDELAAKLSRRGWSTSKIERRLSDFDHADEKRERADHGKRISGEAELDAWVNLIGNILDEKLASHLGIAVNYYHGRLGRAKLRLVRIIKNRSELTAEQLTKIEPETLTIFR